MKPFDCTLQLVDRLVRTPRGWIDNVLAKIDKGFFPIDFVNLDMDPSHASKQMPVILGCSLLITTNYTINYGSKVMDISVKNMRVRLDIFKASSQPVFEDEMIEEVLPTILTKDPLGIWDCLT